MTTDRQGFLKDRFYNGQGYVQWSEATSDDHRGAVSFLTDLGNGDESPAIKRHYEAIARLEAGHSAPGLDE